MKSENIVTLHKAKNLKVHRKESANNSRHFSLSSASTCVFKDFTKKLRAERIDSTRRVINTTNIIQDLIWMSHFTPPPQQRHKKAKKKLWSLYEKSHTHDLIDIFNSTLIKTIKINQIFLMLNIFLKMRKIGNCEMLSNSTYWTWVQMAEKG